MCNDFNILAPSIKNLTILKICNMLLPIICCNYHDLFFLDIRIRFVTSLIVNVGSMYTIKMSNDFIDYNI